MNELERPEAIPPTRDVYCNRTLNLRTIKAIGYDMDYTLLHYRVAEWEECAYEHARQRLAALGWPVASLRFDYRLMIQWLTVDKETGNLVKANRFGYVKGAYHGTQPIPFERQREIYARVIVDHREARFAFMSTLFSLSEACLFAQLVDLWDANELPEVESYAELYRQVRDAVDWVHQAGQLKAEIVADPERFVELDPDTPLALLDQKRAGKKLLLITNSEWPYTRVMMAYAFDRFLTGTMTWRDLFDLVVVSARKPDFFSSRADFLEVVSDEGLLKPFMGQPERDKVYYGGNAAAVERHLSLRGEQLLYVGDHFFGDVEVSKRVLRWRTMLIVRELEDELESFMRFAPQQAELEALMEEKATTEFRYCQRRLAALRQRAGDDDEAAVEEASLRTLLEASRAEIAALDERISPLARASSELGNSNWGPLMRAGNDKSYLAFLLERHADIYTSRVSNLLLQTPYAYFRSARGTLPHDRRMNTPL